MGICFVEVHIFFGLFSFVFILPIFYLPQLLFYILLTHLELKAVLIISNSRWLYVKKSLIFII